jgi:outer membrane protein assembly factor BamB
MSKRTIYTGLILVIILAGVISGGWWLFHDASGRLKLSVPGMDMSGNTMINKEAEVKIGEIFTLFKTGDEMPGLSWPRFRGTGFDNISREKIHLIDSWGQSGPKILWRVNLGEGHAAPAVYNGRVYILDYDEARKTDALKCFSLKNGEELWTREYHVHLKRNHGFSRTIPAVNDKFVVSIGPGCQVMCVDRISGDFRWGIDLVKSFKAEVPFWYTGQCPLLAGDTVILAPGGRALMVAVECSSGKVLWETPNPKGWKMSHSSVMPFSFQGRKMYVYFAIGGIAGISADGQDAGKLLWDCTDFAPAVVVPSPVVLENGRILLTAGYGAGSAMLQLREHDGKYIASVIQQYRPQEGIASEQQTPVYYKGIVYSIMPKDAGGMRNQFVAVSPRDGKKILFSSGKNERFGLGPYLVADDKFFILDDDAELSIAKVSGSEFRVLDKTRIIEGQDAWGPLALTGGYLLMRDSKQMVCIDIRAK